MPLGALLLDGRIAARPTAASGILVVSLVLGRMLCGSVRAGLLVPSVAVLAWLFVPGGVGL